MLRHNRHLPELLILVPLSAAQLAMAVQSLLHARRRYSGTAFTAGAAFLVLLLALMASSVLCSFYFVAFPLWTHVPRLARFVTVIQPAVYIWLFCSAPSYFIWLIYRRFADSVEAHPDPVRRRLVHAAGGLAVAAPFVTAAFGTIFQRVDFQVKEVDLAVPNLAQDLRGLRILQLSDIHLGSFLSERELARVIDQANELRPNLAFMTGDLISTWGDPIDACLRQLKRVRSDVGMLGCLGNHEAYTNTEEYVTGNAAKMGIDFLRQRNRPLRFGKAVLNVAGVDYQTISRKDLYLRGAEQLKVEGSLNLLLSHNPDVFPVAATQGWDITLSGHTHGGQMTVEILEQTLNPARFYTRYVSGLYQQPGALCYVTRGIGTVAVPMRIGATPEITLIRLVNA